MDPDEHDTLDENLVRPPIAEWFSERPPPEVSSRRVLDVLDEDRGD
jgi:hypothetical protein